MDQDEDAGELLRKLSQHGAFSPCPGLGSEPLFCDADMPGLQRLLDAGLAAESERPDCYYVTRQGCKHVNLLRTVTRPTPLHSYSRFKLDDQVSTDWTCWEITLHLFNNGWTDKQLEQRAKVPPLLPASEKVYYHHAANATGGLFKEYLLCLAKLDKLFQGGLEKFHFFQLKSYYVALLQQELKGGLKRVRPNQPASFYKLLDGLQPRRSALLGPHAKDFDEGRPGLVQARGGPGYIYIYK
jgi:hypothetical protein